MKVMDVGCTMGYFSLEFANLVGNNGKVICVDMQEKMLAVLKKLAGKVNLLERVETRLCNQESLGLDDLKEKLDFVLAFAILHGSTIKTIGAGLRESISRERKK